MLHSHDAWLHGGKLRSHGGPHSGTACRSIAHKWARTAHEPSIRENDVALSPRNCFSADAHGQMGADLAAQLLRASRMKQVQATARELATRLQAERNV